MSHEIELEPSKYLAIVANFCLHFEFSIFVPFLICFCLDIVWDNLIENFVIIYIFVLSGHRVSDPFVIIIDTKIILMNSKICSPFELHFYWYNLRPNWLIIWAAGSNTVLPRWERPPRLVRLVRTPYIWILRPYKLLNTFGQVKIVYQCYIYFKSSFSCS